MRDAGMTASPPGQPVDRLIDAAVRLFRAQGIQATGVSDILAIAGVARGTLYARFGSKAGLIRAVLARDADRWRGDLIARLEARTPVPLYRLILLFDVVADDIAGGEAACPLILSARADGDPEDEIAANLAAEQLDLLRAYLSDQAVAAGLADSRRLGRELTLLVLGVLTAATTERATDGAAIARDLAQRLVDAQPRLDHRGMG